MTHKRLCEVLRNTISSEYNIIKQEKIEDQILISYVQQMSKLIILTQIFAKSL